MLLKKYNNTYHTSIKMKPVDVKGNTYIDSNDKNRKFKVGDHLKGICQIGQDKYLLLRKLKALYHGHMLLMTLMVKKLLVLFIKMNCKRLIEKSLE